VRVLVFSFALNLKKAKIIVMKRFCFLFLYLVSLTLYADNTIPIGLVPAGWQVFENAHGDLNGDGIEDLVLTCGRNKVDGKEGLLLVYFGVAGGKFKKAVESPKAICFGCGGAKSSPDFPLGTPSILKGILTLEYTGGSRETWTTQHKFRWQGDRLALIGTLSRYEDTAAGNRRGFLEHEDFNFSTGKSTKTVAQGKGKKSRIYQCEIAKYSPRFLDTFNFEEESPTESIKCK
jgi:hypothetical protein